MKLRTTPDGISAKDWNKIHDLSLAIVNATEGQYERAVTQLFTCLDTLERKYGSLPSILATKADFLDNPQKRIALYQRAYDGAGERGDKVNLTLIASSIAQIYAEELQDLEQGQRCLTMFKECLSAHGDEYLREEYQRLCTIMNKRAD